MQENLLGYLLGALDGPEHEEIRRQLEVNPDLREQLSELESRLVPLEQERWQHEPPAGLAASTCAMIAERSAQATPQNPKSYRAGSKSSATTRGMSRASMSEWNPRKHGWDMIDAAVAAGIFIAAAMLFFPAIANSRQQARMLGCQDNLRNANVALSLYGSQNRGVFPYIPPTGKTSVAGYYAPQLKDTGLLTTNASFLCPSSFLASNKRDSFVVPTIDRIQAAEGEELMRMQETMGGSYMYTLGHNERGKHRATRNRGRSYFPVMADGFEAPELNGQMVSAHGGNGINVVFEGGNVRFLVRLSRQHPYFVSQRGLVEAGSHVNDAVLGHSWARPTPVQYVGNDPESPSAPAAPSARLLPRSRLILRFKFPEAKQPLPEFGSADSDLMTIDG